MVGRQGFFAALFDFSFAELVTTRFARAAYRIAITAAGVLVLVFFVYGVMKSRTLGIALVVGGGVAFLLCVVLLRVWLEALVVVSRIAAQTEEIAEQVAGIALNTARGSEVEPSARGGSASR